MTHDHDDDEPIQEPTRWRDELWTAQVLKNEDDDGWAVSMTRRGDPEPARTCLASVATYTSPP